MGHGGSGTKRLGLPRYAQKFAARGMAVLVFDYRGWGASEGEPRQVIDVAAQRDDYCAAIQYALGNPGIDSEHVACGARPSAAGTCWRSPPLSPRSRP
ncbi:MAG: alpha/beta hydrolase [Micromonosporaceae bacterium]